MDAGFPSFGGIGIFEYYFGETVLTLSMLLTALPGTAGEGAERQDSVSRFIDFVVFRVSVRTGAAVSLLVVRGLGHSQL